jgi:hypothetical protein
MAEAEASGPPGPSLSGMAYMDHAYYEDGDNYNVFGRGAQSRFIALRHDRDAMRWLMENADGAPVILEAFHPGGGYRWGSRFSIYTGLPTIIGWDWHQTQQRNAGGRAVIDARTADVLTLYSGTDDATARQLLAKYGVEYVVIGELERALYPAEGLGKFERWVQEGRAERVYESPPDMKDSLTGEPAVRIYRLRPDAVSGLRPARAEGRPS